jgi:hypothetical protein
MKGHFGCGDGLLPLLSIFMPAIFPMPTCTVAAISLPSFFLDVLQGNCCIHLAVLRVCRCRYGLRLSVGGGHRDGVVPDVGNGSHDVFHTIVRVDLVVCVQHRIKGITACYMALVEHRKGCDECNEVSDDKAKD